MTLQHQNADSYERFFKTIDALDGRQMADAVISYIAFRADDRWQLAHAKLYLDGVPDVNLAPYETPSVRVARHRILDLSDSVKGFLDNSISATAFTFPEGVCTFSCDSYGYSTHVMDLHPEGVQAGNRLRMLTISGGRIADNVNNIEISWELKGNSQPFDSLEELTSIYGTGLPSGGQSKVEIIAYQTTAIERSASAIKDTEATLSQVLLKGFNPAKASLGYIVYKGGRALQRGSLSGDALVWATDSELQRGYATLTVERGAVIKCFACYGGITHHEAWINDPSLTQNPRRTAYETFDEGLAALKSLLDGPYVKGRDARQVEAAVAWLLWMLGFSPIHIGAISKTQTAPDLIVAAPNGNLAVIECTTGLLSADKKLPQLVARTVQVRKRLDAAGNAGVQLLSILITTKSREEVKAELDQAIQSNVLVVTREDIEKALSQSVISTDANAIYSQAVSTLNTQRQPNRLPF